MRKSNHEASFFESPVDRADGERVGPVGLAGERGDLTADNLAQGVAIAIGDVHRAVAGVDAQTARVVERSGRNRAVGAALRGGAGERGRRVHGAREGGAQGAAREVPPRRRLQQRRPRGTRAVPGGGRGQSSVITREEAIRENA